MTDNHEKQSGADDGSVEKARAMAEELAVQAVEAAEPDLPNLEPRQQDTTEQLEAKLRALDTLADEVQETLKKLGDPNASRDELLAKTEEYAKRLGMWQEQIDATPSLSLLGGMTAVIDRFRGDIEGRLRRR